MTQEDKELLLKDLSARLPYRVKIELTWWDMGEGTCINITLEPDHIEQLLNDEDGDTEIKPYLFPLSSMTDEEWEDYQKIRMIDWVHGDINETFINAGLIVDWLNAHHFDYRGLIPKGLAIEVTKENNLYENINL